MVRSGSGVWLYGMALVMLSGAAQGLDYPDPWRRARIAGSTIARAQMEERPR